MDLAKAKSVIIIILISFNLFILYQILSYYNGQDIPKETIKNTERILKARGISLECDIPVKMNNAHKLVYSSEKLNRSVIAEALLGNSYQKISDGTGFEAAGKKLVFPGDTKFVFTDTGPAGRLDTDDQDEVEKYARTYLKDRGLLPGGYVVDRMERNSDGSMVVMYIENYGGYLVFDNYCSVTVASGGVTRLEYEKLQLKRYSNDMVEDLAAAYQVLLANFKEGDNLVITQIDLGYKYSEKNTMDGMESSELLPVWRIKIKGDPNPRYLSSLNAGEESAEGGSAESGFEG